MDTLFQELDPPTQASGYSGRGSPSGYPPPFFFFSASSSVPMLESGGGWRRGLVLVYDLGGGTFDVSVLEDENDLFEEPLTRAKFEELNLDLFKKTMEVVKETLVDAKIEKSEIDEIVLVGTEDVEIPATEVSGGTLLVGVRRRLAAGSVGVEEDEGFGRICKGLN
ncbi:Heat shock 70 kDa protein BIP3 [Linum perenne]